MCQPVSAPIKCPLARDIARAFRDEANKLLGQVACGVEGAAAARALILAAKIIDEKNRVVKEE